MNYDDTVERLAIAVASQIKTAKDYGRVYNDLNSIKDTNMYAIAMLDMINERVDGNIITEWYIDSLIEDNESTKKPTSGLKKTSILTKILRIFKRGK